MEPISRGVDVSRWQGDFDFGAAQAEGFSFAILKGGGGDSGLYTDTRFDRNYREATDLGMPVGAYWYSCAMNPTEAVREADYFWEHCLKGREFQLPVYMDVEQEQMLDLGRRKLTDVIHAFCRRLEEKGFWVGVYSSQSFFSHYMIDSELQRYSHWVACWKDSCDYAGESLGMWQYGGEVNKLRSNQVAGVVCDQNYMLVDYPTLIKAAGKNGLGPAVEDNPLPLRMDIPAKGEITVGMLRDYLGALLGTRVNLETHSWGIRVTL